MKRMGMAVAVLLLTISSCGSGDTETEWLHNLFSHIYKNRNTDIFQQRMQPVLIEDLRLKRYRLLHETPKIAEQLNNIQLAQVKKHTLPDGRLAVSGLIKENYFKGKQKQRTFLAKFAPRPKQGDTTPPPVLYDLVLLEDNRLQQIPAILRMTTLSTGTVKLLRTLTNKTVIQVFDKLDQNLTTHLCKEFTSWNPGFLTMVYYNPDIERGTAKAYGIEEKGYFVVESGKQSLRIKEQELFFDEATPDGATRVKYQGERQLAIAVYRTGIRPLTLQYITGTGERETTGNALESLQTLYDRLSLFGFQTTRGPLAGINSKKPDRVLLFGHPRRSLSAFETARLQQFIAAGGLALLLLEKPVPAGFVNLLAGWGIGTIPGKTIVDPPYKHFIKGPAWMDSIPLPTGPTRIFANRPKFTVLFSHVTGLKLLRKQTGAEKWAPHALIATSTNSWAETSYDDEKPGEVGFTPGWDIKGPIDLAFAVSSEATNRPSPGRILVIGDADFISNRHFETKASNWEFLRELLNWLCAPGLAETAPRLISKSLQTLWK